MASQKVSGLKPDEVTLQRSANMRAIKARDTKPELIVRKLITQLGFRYRLHRKGLPGRPDLAFPGRRAIIFVHGCYWHRHSCRRGRSLPATNARFWKEKLEKNARRDKKHINALREMGWRTLVIWQCELKDLGQLSRKVQRFLDRGVGT
jgi:DNA mismatch endonuclease (patch repair protein)